MQEECRRGNCSNSKGPTYEFDRCTNTFRGKAADAITILNYDLCWWCSACLRRLKLLLHSICGSSAYSPSEMKRSNPSKKKVRWKYWELQQLQSWDQSQEQNGMSWRHRARSWKVESGSRRTISAIQSQMYRLRHDKLPECMVSPTTVERTATSTARPREDAPDRQPVQKHTEPLERPSGQHHTIINTPPAAEGSPTTPGAVSSMCSSTSSQECIDKRLRLIEERFESCIHFGRC